MRTGLQGTVKGIGYFPVLGQLVIPTTTTPGLVTCTGPAARFVTSCTYSATGVYTLVFTSDFQFPSAPSFTLDPQCADLTNWYEAIVVGGYNATTKTLVINCHRSGVANAPAAATGAQIVVDILGYETQGK